MKFTPFLLLVSKIGWKQICSSLHVSTEPTGWFVENLEGTAWSLLLLLDEYTQKRVRACVAMSYLTLYAKLWQAWVIVNRNGAGTGMSPPAAPRRGAEGTDWCTFLQKFNIPYIYIFYIYIEPTAFLCLHHFNEFILNPSCCNCMASWLIIFFRWYWRCTSATGSRLWLRYPSPLRRRAAMLSSSAKSQGRAAATWPRSGEATVRTGSSWAAFLLSFLFLLFFLSCGSSVQCPAISRRENRGFYKWCVKVK